ncbi:MAG TPA: site-specific DNA-methyltransferase [Acidimicrobiales bacterium]|jgi:DNA modification methylase|nr:site-specific DNA-methyltransferase [Acidimicrobiales bacterium]
MRSDILVGDARDVLLKLPDESFSCCVTSPPYFGLRDYGNDGQIGLEASPAGYVEELTAVFREVRRVLTDDGTLWLNLGDSYSHGGNGSRDAERWPKQPTNDHRIEHQNRNTGVAPKNLLGIPWRVAFALQDDGWYLRSDIIWAKPNPMPESVKDRPTKSHEYLFLLSKSPRYYYDADGISESVAVSSVNRLNQDLEAQAGSSRAHDGTKVMKAVAPASWNGSRFDTGKTADHQLQTMQRRTPPRFGGTKYGEDDAFATYSGNEYEETGRRNKRDVWTVSSEPFAGAHFAVMPTELVRPCVLAGSPEGGNVLDPFAGSGTVGVVALRAQRNFTGIELNPIYAQMAADRIRDDGPMLNDVHLTPVETKETK